MDKEEKIIEIIAKNRNEYASELGYSYLDGGHGCWKNGSGEVYKIDEMDEAYLENAINFVNRGIEELENGEMKNYIDKHLKQFVRKKDFNDDLKYKRIKVTKIMMERTTNELIEALVMKKKELEEYL